MRSDFRLGMRRLFRNPGFSILAIAILALGCGASTAVFSIIDAALLRPLPGVADPGRLVTLYRTQKGDSFDNFSYPDYLDLRDDGRAMSGLAAHTATMVNFRSGATERVRADLVTPNYFTVLGVTATAGRLLGRQETDDVAILSYDFWQRRFAGSLAAIGAKIAINGFPFTVAGVTAPDFRGTVAGEAFDLWLPLASQPRSYPRLSFRVLENRAAGWIEIFGRLRPDATVRRANAEMQAIAGRLAEEHPVTNGARSVAVIAGLGWYPEDRAEALRLIQMLGGAVSLLALIACANLAGLFLMRASGRQREVAVRLAVGGTGRQIVRMLLAETVIVAAAAGALGLVLARWTAAWMALMRPSSAARRLDVGIDAKVVLFAVLASMMAGVLFPMLPALRSAPADLAAALRNGGRGSGSRRSGWRTGLIVAQVAVSFLLISAAGLLGRDLHRLLAADPGYATSHVAMAGIDLTLERYSESRALSVYRQLLDRLQQRPGIVSATMASSVPPAQWPGRVSIFRPGEEPPPEELQGREMELGLRVDLHHIAPHYFETLGVRLLAGRDFTLHDDRDAPLVAIVNQALASSMWPRENPIGKRLAWPPWSGSRRPPLEVVGLAADTRSRALNAAAVPALYVPVWQNYNGRMLIVVRTRGDVPAVFPQMASAVSEVDPDLAVFGAETMEQHVAQSLWSQRTAFGGIGIFAFLAIGLTAIGLYGVMAQSVTQRRREMGIRMALGAIPSEISGLVVKDGCALALAGIGLGAPISIAARSGDGMVWLAGGAVLVGVLLLASWIPARRAARFDPVKTLRAD